MVKGLGTKLNKGGYIGDVIGVSEGLLRDMLLEGRTHCRPICYYRCDGCLPMSHRNLSLCVCISTHTLSIM